MKNLVLYYSSIFLFISLLSTLGESLTLQWTYPKDLPIQIEKVKEVRFHIYRQDNCEGHYILKGIVYYPADTFKDSSSEKGKIYCYILTTVHEGKESPYGDYMRVEEKE